MIRRWIPNYELYFNQPLHGIIHVSRLQLNEKNTSTEASRLITSMLCLAAGFFPSVSAPIIYKRSSVYGVSMTFTREQI